MIGQVIGTYKILDKIGEGGMGVVYKGMDIGLERPVAIKVLTPDFAHNPELIERFRSEAKAQANLNHTNITTLYAFLQIEGQCLIVMEYIEGETFEDTLVRRGKLPWPEAVAMTQQALHGLSFAHRMNIIHRDIKPSNLMLTKNGVVKIMDFGIAKALGGSTKTRTGLQMGTPQYMSPEQIRGRQVDARADLYSLGITLYQLLSGDLPFQADSDYELMSAHINTPPPVLTDIHKDVPAGIEQCVRRALAKEPDGRFQNADEFANALDLASRPPQDLMDPVVVGTHTAVDFGQGMGRKTVIETSTPYRQKTLIETPIPRIPTPVPSPAPAPAPAPIARKKSPLVPILVAAVVGAAIAGVAIWKLSQPKPEPVANIVGPQKSGPTGTGTANLPGSTVPGRTNSKPGNTATQPPIHTANPPVEPRTRERQPAAAAQANLIVLCTLDCAWTLDGQPQGQLGAGRPGSVKVPLGTHMVTAASLDGLDSNDLTINAAAPMQNIPVRMDLAFKRAQRTQAEVFQQRQQQQQAAQEAIRQRQQAAIEQARARTTLPATPQPGSAPAMVPAITSPCQIPSLHQVYVSTGNSVPYRFSVNCDHVDIFDARSNRIVADLTAKKGKWVGVSPLSPCGMRGKMEILSVSQDRIEARVEIPNAMNRSCTNGMFLAFTNWAPASFIAQ
jgi:serine/threonine protein kinase